MIMKLNTYPMKTTGKILTTDTMPGRMALSTPHETRGTLDDKSWTVSMYHRESRELVTRMKL